jgi:hypothetical protein
MTSAASGNRYRFGPLNPPAKIVKLGNKLGDFLNALNQSLSTTGTTHNATLAKRTEVQSSNCQQMYHGPELSNAGGILFA